jgi:hypothetical protein
MAHEDIRTRLGGRSFVLAPYMVLRISVLPATIAHASTGPMSTTINGRLR